ncbi:hypothetical protein HanIR_Chr13g0621601 [Helianthus annuus]|nr:hypothetical protein HanIR_Chr13g0621601 [Helianthus annuus]
MFSQNILKLGWFVCLPYRPKQLAPQCRKTYVVTADCTTVQSGGVGVCGMVEDGDMQSR